MRKKPVVERKEVDGNIVYYRDGVPLEKGARIDKKRIEANRELYEKYCDKFTAYPDLFKRAA